MSSPKQVQQALVSAGFNPGIVNGVIGRNTIAAIKKFQAKKGLEVDGIAGKQTLAALGLQSTITPAPTDTHEEIPAYLPWLVEARRLVGLKEFAGNANNPTLMKIAQELDVEKTYTGDDVPWCGLFVGHCIASQLPEESLPSGLLMARNWRKFGSEVAPSLGAVMVFWRGKKRLFGACGFLLWRG